MQAIASGEPLHREVLAQARDHRLPLGARKVALVCLRIEGDRVWVAGFAVAHANADVELGGIKPFLDAHSLCSGVA